MGKSGIQQPYLPCLFRSEALPWRASRTPVHCQSRVDGKPLRGPCRKIGYLIVVFFYLKSIKLALIGLAVTQNWFR